MSDQAKIDRILTWAGFKKKRNIFKPTLFLWVKGDLQLNYGTTDPFESPSDCAVVMDEVSRRVSDKGRPQYHIDYSVGSWTAMVELLTQGFPIGWGRSKESWMDAFCEAVLAMAGEG